MHRIFHHDSEMLGRTFRALGLSLPTPDTVSIISGDVTEIRPMERRIDTLMRCETANGEAYLVLVESQRAVDEDKKYTWTYYLAYLADKYRLPVLLLVICHDHRVARWAAQPFKHGAGAYAALTLRAVVVGPHNVPGGLRPGGDYRRRSGEHPGRGDLEADDGYRHFVVPLGLLAAASG